MIKVNPTFKNLKKKFGVTLVGLILASTSSFGENNIINLSLTPNDGIKLIDKQEIPNYTFPNYTDSKFNFIEETLSKNPSFIMTSKIKSRNFNVKFINGKIGRNKFNIYYNTLNKGNLISFRSDWKKNGVLDEKDLILNLPGKYIENSTKITNFVIKKKVIDFINDEFVNLNYKKYSLFIEKNSKKFVEKVFKKNLDIDIFLKGKCGIFSKEIAQIDNKYSVCVDYTGVDGSEDFVKVGLFKNYKGGNIEDDNFIFYYVGKSKKYSDLTSRLNSNKFRDAFYPYILDAVKTEKLYEKFERKNSEFGGIILSSKNKKLNQFRINSILAKRHSKLLDLSVEKSIELIIQENSSWYEKNGQNKYGHMQIGGNAIKDVKKYMKNNEKFQREVRIMKDYFGKNSTYKNNFGLNSLYGLAYYSLLRNNYSKKLKNLYSDEDLDKISAMGYQIGPLIFDIAKENQGLMYKTLHTKMFGSDFVDEIKKYHKATARWVSKEYMNGILTNN